MIARGIEIPEQNFRVEKYDDINSIIIFYDNIETLPITEGEEGAEYQWDEYKLIKQSYDNLELDVANNYDAWLAAAKAKEEEENPPDPWQMRADIDFLTVMYAL